MQGCAHHETDWGNLSYKIVPWNAASDLEAMALSEDQDSVELPITRSTSEEKQPRRGRLRTR